MDFLSIGLFLPGLKGRIIALNVLLALSVAILGVPISCVTEVSLSVTVPVIYFC
jgi:hypothetical protein